jgi:hypothetical protein
MGLSLGEPDVLNKFGGATAFVRSTDLIALVL